MPADRSKFRKRGSVIVITALIITNLITAGWLLVELRSENDKTANPYPLIDIMRNFIPQEHFIVNIQPLREELRALVEREGKNSITLYFEFLNTGANVSINPDLRIWPASLPKLPMAMTVMKRIENGTWSLDNELVLFEQDKDFGYGKLFERPVGTRFTIEELLEEMLVRSDNAAYRILLRNTDLSELVGVIQETGLEDLFTEGGRVSAKEYSRLFRSLYTSSFLERENSQKILSLLAQSEFRDFLTSGVPADIPFSHKFGIDRDEHVYLDAGIVYAPNRPYLLAVMVKGTGVAGEEEKVKQLMKEMSEKAYTYVSQQ